MEKIEIARAALTRLDDERRALTRGGLTFAAYLVAVVQEDLLQMVEAEVRLPMPPQDGAPND